MTSAFRPLFRLFLSFLLIWQGLVPSLLEASVWSERAASRKPIQLAGLSAANPFSLPPVEHTLSAVSTPRRAGTGAPILSAFGARFGRIRANAGANPNGRLVIHVQDIHRNAEAQRNISDAIKAALGAGPVAMVAVEGGFGDIDLREERGLVNDVARRTAADYLLSANRIAGPLHAALTAPGAPAKIVGIDDRVLYDRNVDAYRRANGLVAAQKTRLGAWRLSLSADRPRLNPDLRRFEDLEDAFDAGTAPFGRYVEELDRQFPGGPQTTLFLQALALERQMDFSAVESERSRFLEALVHGLSAPGQKRLVALSLAYRAGELDHAGFYAALRAECAGAGVAIEKYSLLDRYMRYVEISSAIDGDRLSAETENARTTLEGRLARSDAERAYVDGARRYRLAEKLVRFALSPADWRENARLSTGARPSFAGAEAFWRDLSAFEDFYRAAEQRDAAMARRVLDAARGSTGPIVLVTGGFHTSGIGAALNREGFAVATFIPKLTTVDVDGASLYLTAFTQEKAPLERLGQGEKLFLAQPVWTPGIRLTTRVYSAIADLFLRWASFTPASASRRFTEVTGLVAVRLVHKSGSLSVETEQGPVRVDAEFDGNGRMTRADEKAFVLPLRTRLARAVTELPATLRLALPGAPRAAQAAFIRAHGLEQQTADEVLARVAGFEAMLAATRAGAVLGLLVGAAAAVLAGLPVLFAVALPFAAAGILSTLFNVGAHAAFNVVFPCAPLALGEISPEYREASEKANALWTEAHAIRGSLDQDEPGTAGTELFDAIGLNDAELARYAQGEPAATGSLVATRYALPDTIPSDSPLAQLISLAGVREFDIVRDTRGRPIAIVPALSRELTVPAGARWLALWYYDFDPPRDFTAPSLARWMNHEIRSQRTLKEVQSYISATGRSEMGRLGSLLDEDGSHSHWFAIADAIGNPATVNIASADLTDSLYAPWWLIASFQERAKSKDAPSAIGALPVYPTVFSPASSEIAALDRGYQTEIVRLSEAFGLLWGYRDTTGPLDVLVMGGGSGVDSWLLSQAWEFARKNGELPDEAELRIRVRDVNPIAVANVRATARLNGIRVEAEVGGIPTSGSHDLVVWNMPSYSPNRRDNSKLGHAYQRHQDGDDGTVLLAFSEALPRLLNKNGLAVLWNGAFFESTDTQSIDVVEEALRTGGAFLRGKSRVPVMQVGTTTDRNSLLKAKRLTRVYFVRHLDLTPNITFGSDHKNLNADLISRAAKIPPATWSLWAAPWAGAQTREEAVRRAPWLESIATLIGFFSVAYAVTGGLMWFLGAYDHATAALIAGFVANAVFAVLHIGRTPVMPKELRSLFQMDKPGSPLARTAEAFGLRDAVIVDGPTEVAGGLQEYTLAPRSNGGLSLLLSELGNNIPHSKLVVRDGRPIAFFPELSPGIQLALARLADIAAGARAERGEFNGLTSLIKARELRFVDLAGIATVPAGLKDRLFWGPFFERRDADRAAVTAHLTALKFPFVSSSLIRSADAGKLPFVAVDIDFGRQIVVPENFENRRWPNLITRYQTNGEPNHERFLLTVMPLVYSPAFEGVAEEDEGYYKAVMHAPATYEAETGRKWSGGERVLLIGAGTGLDTLMLLLSSLRRTGHTLTQLQEYVRSQGRAPPWAPVIEARDVNPLAVQNTKYLFASLGISPVVDARVGTLPESPDGAPYDVVLWNMPLHPGETERSNLVETRTMIQYQDGGTNGVDALNNLAVRLPALLAANGIGIFWNHAVVDRAERDIFKQTMNANEAFTARKLSVTGGNDTGESTVYRVVARADRSGKGPTAASASIDARGEMSGAAKIAWLCFAGAAFHGPFFLAAAFAPALLPLGFAWAVAAHRGYNFFVTAARHGRLGRLLSRRAAVLPFAAIERNGPSREALESTLPFDSAAVGRRIVDAFLYEGLGVPDLKSLKFRDLGNNVAETEISTSRLDQEGLQSAFDAVVGQTVDGMISLVTYSGVPTFLVLRTEKQERRAIDLSRYVSDHGEPSPTLRADFEQRVLGGRKARYQFEAPYVFAWVAVNSVVEISGNPDPQNARYIDWGQLQRIRVPVLPGVFEGLHSSSLISARATMRFVKAGQKVLIIGAGQGLETVIAARIGAKVESVDRKKLAVLNTRLALAINGIDPDSVNVHQGDLFPAGGVYDYVGMNMPHVKYWGDPEPNETVGNSNVTDHAGALAERAASALPEHLAPGGRAVFVNSELSTLERNFRLWSGLSVRGDFLNVPGDISIAYIFTPSVATWSFWTSPWAFGMAREKAIERAPWLESGATLIGFFGVAYAAIAGILTLVGAYDHVTATLIAGLIANGVFAALHDQNRGRFFLAGAIFHAPFIFGIAALPALFVVSPFLAIAVTVLTFLWAVLSHRTHNDGAQADAAANDILRRALDLPPVQSMGLENGGRPVSLEQLTAAERDAAFTALENRARRLAPAERPAPDVAQRRLTGLFSTEKKGSAFAEAGEKNFVVPVSLANQVVVEALVAEAASQGFRNEIRIVLPSNEPQWADWFTKLSAKSSVRLIKEVAAVTREDGTRTVVLLPALEAEIQRQAPTAADRKNMAVLLAGEIFLEGGTRAEFSDLMRDVEVRMVISAIEGAWSLSSMGSLNDLERAARLVSIAA